MAYADPPFDLTSIRLESVKTPTLLKSQCLGKGAYFVLLLVAS